MTSRTLLCVEPDEAVVEVIRRTVEPYGFEVENIPNGESAIDWARDNEPMTILVSVEPRKVGYAVCNKIKRSSELAHIPLILTSAEETLQTFEQHKKLKSRADEYLLKPVDPEELLVKLGNLIPLDGPASGNGSTGTHGRGVDPSVELSVGDSDIVEENATQVARRVGPFDSDPFGGGGLEDLDKETDAAFAAIVSQGSGETTPIPTDPLASGLPSWDEENTSAQAVSSTAFLSTDESVHTGTSLEILEEPEDLSGEVPPSPDEVDVAPAYPDPALEAKIAEQAERIHALETERQRLQEQIEEGQLRLQSQPLSREKEFLSLREIINRKEKDLLDLRDALDAKDRQILDQKDRGRESERGQRDLEEKILTIEKAMMAAQERVAALTHDKEKAIEREKGLKARLDDALTEIQKAHDEVDQGKKRLAQTEEKSRAELERVRTELETRLFEAEEHAKADLSRLAEERSMALEELRNEHQAEITGLRSTQAQDLEAAQKRFSEEKTEIENRLGGELVRQRKEHEKALASTKDEHALQLAAEREAHQGAIEAKERDHKNEIQSLRRQLEEELAAAEERRQRELAEAESRREADLDAAEQRRRTELQGREDEHHGKLAEMDRLHFNEKTELGERHRQELDLAHARAARAEGELAARTEELGEVQRRLGSTETDRDGLRADLRDRDVKLGQLRDRAAELEAKAAEYEDQILRAYQKLRSDEKVVDKAKKALAVALSLLDERSAPSSGTPSGGVPIGGTPSGGVPLTPSSPSSSSDSGVVAAVGGGEVSTPIEIEEPEA